MRVSQPSIQGTKLEKAVVSRAVTEVVRPALDPRPLGIPPRDRVRPAPDPNGKVLDAEHVLRAVGPGVDACNLPLRLHHPRIEERVVMTCAVDQRVSIGALPVLRQRQYVRGLEAVHEVRNRYAGREFRRELPTASGCVRS